MRIPEKHRGLIIGLVVAVVAFVAVAIFYLADGHPKHAMLAVALAIACGVGLWFSTGSEAQTR